MRKIIFTLLFFVAFLSFPFRVAGQTFPAGVTDNFTFLINPTAHPPGVRAFVLRFADDAIPDYEPGRDFLFGYAATDSIIMGTVLKISENTTNSGTSDQFLPLSCNDSVKIGFSVPAAGNYRILLSTTASGLKVTKVKKLLLVDNNPYTGISDTTDMLIAPNNHFFDTYEPVNGNNTRFKLLIYEGLVLLVNGTSIGTYIKGEVVPISAGPAPIGKVFDQWTGSGISSVKDIHAANTTYTMGCANNSITALFKDVILPTPLPMPMLVSGNVHISGPLRSEESVHIFSDSGKIDIDDTYNITDGHALLKTDTIIFYSSDTFDGLLRNTNISGGGVKGIAATDALQTPPTYIVVRKTFMGSKYTYFSLPFKVSPTSILKGYTNTPLPFETDNGGYWAWGFDALVRSGALGYANPLVWRKLTGSDNFEKAMGYLFWFDNTGNLPEFNKGVVDFITKDQTAITDLFAYSSKPVTYTMYRTTNINNDLTQEGYDAGWAFFGGLNSSVFSLLQKNVGGYDGGKIYYQHKKNAQSTLTELHNNYDAFILGTDDAELETGFPAKVLSVGPFTPFYIQGKISTVGTVTSQFIFKSNPESSLLLEDMTFRSSKIEGPQDRLYFALTSDKNHSFDRFVLSFAGNNSESYIAIEDAIKMAKVFDDKPGVWSLFAETNTALVENGLPMRDNREIRMGFSTPEAGNYTFSLKALKIQNVRNVVLVDNVTGKKVDLLQDSYSFNTGVVDNNNDRFVLYINSSYTGEPSKDVQTPYVYTKDNLLTVKNLTNGDRVQVLDLSGRTIAFGTVSGKEYSTVLGQKGVYVVNIRGEKTSVMKVLNQ